MNSKLAKRFLHLVLLAAVVCSAIFGAFEVSAPFTASAFTDGYPGVAGSCCNYSSQCPGTKRCCNPSSIETPCNPPRAPGYCKDICS